MGVRVGHSTLYTLVGHSTQYIIHAGPIVCLLEPTTFWFMTNFTTTTSHHYHTKNKDHPSLSHLRSNRNKQKLDKDKSTYQGIRILPTAQKGKGNLNMLNKDKNEKMKERQRSKRCHLNCVFSQQTST